MSARVTHTHAPSCSRLQQVLSVGYDRKIASELAQLSVKQQTIAGDAEEAAQLLLALAQPQPQQEADPEQSANAASASTAQSNARKIKTAADLALYESTKQSFQDWANTLAKTAPVDALDNVLGMPQTTWVVASAAAETPDAGMQQATAVVVAPLYGRFCSQDVVLRDTNRNAVDEQAATAATTEFDSLPLGSRREDKWREMQDAELKIMNLCATIKPLDMVRAYRERTVEVPCNGPPKFLEVKLEVLRHMGEDLVRSRVDLTGIEYECFMTFDGAKGEYPFKCQTKDNFEMTGNTVTAVIEIPDARRVPGSKYDWADHLGTYARFLFRPKDSSLLALYPKLSHKSVDFRLVAALDEALVLFPDRPSLIGGTAAQGSLGNYTYNDLSQPPVLQVNAGGGKNGNNPLFHFNVIIARPAWTRPERSNEAAKRGVYGKTTMDIPLECVLVGQWQGIQDLDAMLARGQIPFERDWVPKDMGTALQPLYRSGPQFRFCVKEGASIAEKADFSIPPSSDWPPSADPRADQQFYFRIQPATDVHRKLFPNLKLNTRSFFMKSEAWLRGSPRVYKDGKWEVRRGNKGESSRDGEGGSAE